MNIVDLILQHDRSSVAIAAPEREPATYRDLLDLVDDTRRALSRHGIGRGDRLAIVVENGPEAAAGIVACASTTTVVPLNPALRDDEFASALVAVGAKALLTGPATDTAATAVAARLAIPVLTMRPGDKAGRFTVDGGGMAAASPPAPGTTHGAALMLPTAGTTSPAKIVPLSHANLVASATGIARTLKLSAADRCLNVMPLFHAHGLVGALLASLASGGSIFCTPGFNATRFSAWARLSRATWYTAVPTMHQLILSRVMAGHRRAAKAPLFRFVRSSSAPLPVRLFNDIEGEFGCPAIEAYSMTEAAHQVTSNELPPGRRTAGSVGRPAGSEVSISYDGRPATVGEAGEILIRGATVMAGYEGLPGTNRDAFVHGWLRTGDQGVLDGDGRLRITGRLTEIINRGGEKIAPLEIDNVLLSHPAVRQAVAFAVPHETLGEDVAVAIVLQPGATTTSRDVRRFAARSLADFKVPRRVVFVKAVPAGPTGKPLRTRLAAALGLGSSRGKTVDKSA